MPGGWRYHAYPRRPPMTSSCFEAKNLGPGRWRLCLLSNSLGTRNGQPIIEVLTRQANAFDMLGPDAEVRRVQKGGLGPFIRGG